MVTFATTMPAASVLHGDAYDLLPSLDPQSIDLFITIPPYWGHRTYEQDHNWNVFQDWLETGADRNDIPCYEWYRRNGGALGLEPLPDWYVAHLVEMFELFRPSLKPSGSLWINIGDLRDPLILPYEINKKKPFLNRHLALEEFARWRTFN